MVKLTVSELRNLLMEESDICIQDISQDVVFLDYAPLDLHSDSIFVDGDNYVIELETLVDFVSKNIFSSPVEVMYDKHREVKLFVIEE